MRRVCVIVPAYNATATLARTMESVFAQTHSELSIYVVDDGSTDATYELACDIAAKDPRVTVLQQANLGVAAARNAALRLTDCELVTWLDADDLWHPEKIERQVAVYEAADPKPSLVYTGYRLIDLEDRIIHNFRTLADVSGHTLCRQVATNYFTNVSSIMVPTELARRFGGHDPRLRAWGIEGAEDMLLQLQLATVGPLACCREALVGYRMHPNNMSLGYRRAAGSNLKVVDLISDIAPGIPEWVLRLGRARTVGYALHMAAEGNWTGAAGLVRTIGRDQPAYTALTLALILGWRLRVAVGLGPKPDPEIGKKFQDADPGSIEWFGHMVLAPWHRRALERCDVDKGEAPNAGFPPDPDRSGRSGACDARPCMSGLGNETGISNHS